MFDINDVFDWAGQTFNLSRGLSLLQRDAYAPTTPVWKY